MKHYAVEILPEAMAEAEAARLWYESRSTDVGAAFIAELDTAVESIRANPNIYPPYLNRTRRYLMRRFPYLVVYRVLESSILIVAVAHGRRLPGYWKTRSIR